MDNLTTLIAIAIFCAFFAGNVFSSTQRRWRGRKAAKSKSMPWRPQSSHRPQREPLQTPITDAAEQLRLVMQASFDKKRLMSKDEARVFMLIERAVKAPRLSGVTAVLEQALLADLPAAVRTRVVRRWLREVGATEPTTRVIEAVDELLRGVRPGQVAIGGTPDHRLAVERTADGMRVTRLPR